MEAIKSYLENMFLHLPKTAEVMRAKEELAQMMEDKYSQLRSEGRTDNEAVGQVIIRLLFYRRSCRRRLGLR